MMDNETRALAIYQAKAQLREAFLRLQILDAKQRRIDYHVDKIARFAGLNLNTKIPPTFRQTSQDTTKGQLDDLARIATKLADEIALLSNTAINALADEGWLRGAWEADLRALAVRAKRVDLRALPEQVKAGRPPNKPAHMIARLVEEAFEDLTGRDPRKPVKRNTTDVRGINPLMDRVFEILGIEANPRSALRAEEEAHDNRMQSGAVELEPGMSDQACAELDRVGKILALNHLMLGEMRPGDACEAYFSELLQ